MLSWKIKYSYGIRRGVSRFAGGSEIPTPETTKYLINQKKGHEIILRMYSRI